MTVFDYHTAIDAALARVMAANADKPPCCKQCTSPHCCSEPAYADALEIEWMLEALTPEQLAHVEEGAAQWRGIFGASPMIKEEQTHAFRYRLLNLPCPFLKDGRCLAYERRPLGCREFFAIGNPEDCAMPARMKQKYAAFPHPNLMDGVVQKFFLANRRIDLDHISAHLVRKLLDPEFTTGSHQRIEFTHEEEETQTPR